MGDPFLDLFGDDPELARQQAMALADAMRRRKAAGTVATVVGGPFAAAGRQFSGEAGQTAQDLIGAGQYRAGATLKRAGMAQDAAQHHASLAAQAAAQAESARHNRALEGGAAEARAQDAWSAVPDGYGGVVLYNKKTGETINKGNIPTTPDPKPAPPKIPAFKNEAQGKAFGYAERIALGRKQMEEAGYPEGLGGRKDAAAMGAQTGPISNLVPAEAAGDKGQRYFNAARNVVAALLRKESGAAISDGEWKQFTNLYIPMPADTEDARKNKLEMLDVMHKALSGEAGADAQRYWEQRIQYEAGQAGAGKPAAGDVAAKRKARVEQLKAEKRPATEILQVLKAEGLDK